jgi:hypothetical protein
MHRCYFLKATPDGWIFSAPLSRHCYVPIRLGELLTIEARAPGGVLLYRAVLKERRTNPHVLVVERPVFASRQERRDEPRLRDQGHATLDGGEAILRDISTHGARLAVPAHRKR